MQQAPASWLTTVTRPNPAYGAALLADIGFIIVPLAFLELIFVGTILILIVQPASRASSAPE